MFQQAALLITAFTVVQALYLDRYEKYVANAPGQRWSRIVSGWDAKPGEHPHQAVIRMVNEEGTVGTCGACIVHAEWLLTAAHCTAGKVTIVVRAGLIEITKPEMLLETTEHYRYPSYDASRPGSVQLNDISMIKLKQPLKFSDNLRAIRIQPEVEAYRSYADETLMVSGFGRVWTGGKRADTLQWVYLRGITNDDCVSALSSNYISENNICARYFNTTSQSICQGDNGGPLVHVSSDKEPILIGISSFVAGNQMGCHSGYPSVFTRTGPFHSWYKEVSGIDFDNLQGENNNDTTTSYSTTDSPTTYPTSEFYSTTNSDFTTTSLTTSFTVNSTFPTSPTTTPTPTTVVTPISTFSNARPNSTASSPTTFSYSTSVTPPSISTSTVRRNEDVNNSESQKAMEVDIRVNVKLNKEEKRELSNDNKA